MTIKTQITLRDFLIFHLKSSLLRLIAFPLILLVFFIIKESVDDSTERDILKSASMWFAILLLFLLIRSFFSLKSTFNSNKNIQESIIYTFTEEKVHVQGETFKGDFTWNSVYKVKENKEWFLIYQNAQVMNMVSKKFFTRDQILELRKIIKHNHVKSKLRND